MGDHSAFFYGTLMAPPVLHRVCYGSPKPEPWQAALLKIRPAILHSHCRHKVRDCDYPALVPSKDSTVRGAFVSGLTEGDLFRLDVFEGDEYARRKVKVRLLTHVGDESGVGNVEGEEVETETYIWVAGKEDLDEGEWDFVEFQREKLGRWAGSDEEYRDVDAVVDNQSDPTRGRSFGGSITNQLQNGGVSEIERSAV